jgi:hypothetical protein
MLKIFDQGQIRIAQELHERRGVAFREANQVQLLIRLRTMAPNPSKKIKQPFAFCFFRSQPD